MRAVATVTDQIAWRPTQTMVDQANVARLMRAHGISTVSELHARSLDPDWFWPVVIDDLGLRFERRWDRVLDVSDGPAWPRWFKGARLNLADACLDRWAAEEPERLALMWHSEDGGQSALSYRELARMATGVAAALASLDVEPGDTVGIFLPLAPQAAAALYGCWKVGAIAVPIFSGFGPEAVARRLIDSRARVLLTADSFVRRGAKVAMKSIADTALMSATVIEHVLVCQHSDAAGTPWIEARDVAWDDAVSHDAQVSTLPLPPDHPALLMYTSGSTGRPKGALLTHAGLLVSAAKDAAYHIDLLPDDRLLWVTDIGWIMGPWEIIAAGTRGATVCLLEGAPATPLDRVWRTVESDAVTILGVSPSLIRGLAASAAPPGREHELASLRILAATGEPWDPDAYWWLFREVGRTRLPIINISGGSEVGGAFLAPTPAEEIQVCSLGGPALGMDIAVYDEDGNELGPGEVGELVCRAPWPGMTKGLWDDDGRYIETYWSRFPGAWVHGDWASFNDRGQWFLHGRSDDTLNIGGQRIGPAEAESALTALPEVAEAAAIALPHELKGEAMWCFVVPAGGALPTEALLADAVAAALGKPFRPEHVFVVRDLPRTRSQKILRRVVRAIAGGFDPGDLSSLENPAALDALAEAVGKT